MSKVRILPYGKMIEVIKATSLLAAALGPEIALQQSCKDRPNSDSCHSWSSKAAREPAQRE